MTIDPLAGTGSSDDDAARQAVSRRLSAVAGADYEIVRELGRGGMGLVFLGRDLRLGRLAALKVLPPLDAMRAASLERFRREAATAAGLTHPHIVPIYGAGGDAETPFFAMAYIDGETLAERLARGVPWAGDAEALRIAHEIGSALAYAHRRGVIHRDVKPSNVLLERETGRALLSDFGLARSGAGDGLTLSGFALGTPGYMAPEQAAGRAAVDARADVYALGVLLFEMLTRRSFETEFLAEWPVTARTVRRALAEARPDLAPGVVAAVVRATASRPGDRFATVDDMLSALGGGRAALPARRRARLAWYALAAAALLALGRLVWLAAASGGMAPGGPHQSARVALVPFAGDSLAARALLPMLRYELEGFATVRVADPRIFAPPPGAEPASPEVRAAARRAGAGWILYGFIGPVGPGTGREILLRAIDVERGDVVEIGRDTVADISVAAADSVLLLVARSRVGRAVGLTVPAGATPASLEAVRAFGAAEDAFRRADYAAAVREYDRVARLDPEFALARYKRFLAALQEEPSERAVREAVAEMRRVVPNVGPLERRLLEAYLVLFDSGDVARAERRLQQLVSDDSTFLDGWFALAEVRYHFGALAGLPPDSAERAFRRALALWPDAAPAVMHLVALDLFAGRDDSARAHIARYLAQDSTSSVGRTMALGRRVLFGSAAERLAVLADVSRLSDRVLEFGAITGATVARDRADLAQVRLALEAMTDAGRPVETRSEGARFLVLTYLAEGRWSDARRALAALREALPRDAELARLPALIAELERPGPAPRDTTAAIAALRARLAGLDVPRVPFGLTASQWLPRWTLARLALARGDTAGALALLEAQEFLAAFADQTVRGPVWLLKGRVHAARGDRNAAVRSLRRAANLLVYAEPPWDALRDSAVQQLARLGAQP
jgi:tetratricopeptide (TPR) repeat protein